MDSAARPLLHLALETGEGPVWDARLGCLHFVDITRPRLLSYYPSTGALETLALRERIGFVALTPDPRVLVAGLKSGLARLDLGTGEARVFLAPEPDRPGNRINDGVADLDGGLVFGTLDDAGEREPTGAFYRLAPDGTLERFDSGFPVTNGPWPDPDGTRLYGVDSAGRRIFTWTRGRDGRFRTREVFTDWPADWGYPDGLVCDAARHVWVAHWGGGRVTRFRPDGAVERVVTLPVPRVTKAAFGGEDLRTLYITTADRGTDLARFPHAGALFACEQDVAGDPPRLCTVPLG